MIKNTYLFYLIQIKIIMILFSASSFAMTLNDYGRINLTNVSTVIRVQSESDILKAIQEATSKRIPIAILGKQFSQGGQSLAPNAIALDMRYFNKVLKIDTKKKQVTVQSGITWSDLQKQINPYKLSIQSMQSPNIFTVGGSMSVNAHGDDFRSGSVGNSIVSFHILLANGKKLWVTQKNNPDLWAATIGGYGLIGVITDVTLQLTDNVYLLSHYEETDIDGFPSFFKEKILSRKDLVFFYAHLNIVPDSNFLKKMYVITYKNTHQLPKKIIPLDNPDKWNFILTPMLNLSRGGATGKAWRWKLENIVFKKFYNNRFVTRNNAMEKPVRFASDHYETQNADWLQEYFIPTNELPRFIEILRKVMLENKVNLLNVTIRYVPAENKTFLSYAKTDCFAVVLYFNQDLDSNKIEQTRSLVKKLINAALSSNGRYYLPYQPFASVHQFQNGYPGYKDILRVKRKYDSKGLFKNNFYLKYFMQEN